MNKTQEQQPQAVPIPSMIALDPPDGWVISASSGDYGLDAELGRFYADEIIHYARLVRQPAAITFVLASMLHKVNSGKCVPGAIEHGFCLRIASLAYCGSMN